MTNISNITDKYGQAFLSEPMEKQGLTPTASANEAVETERPQDDRVSLSNASKDLQAAEDAVAAVPDVRQDRVAEIKQAVESGTYEIDPGKIADKMIGSIFDQMV